MTKVDAVSGASYSLYRFRYAVTVALMKARLAKGLKAFLKPRENTLNNKDIKNYKFRYVRIPEKQHLFCPGNGRN